MIITERYRGVYCRVNTSDQFTVREMETYKPMVLDKDDVVLDLGANIGAFAVLRASHCRRVICIEPEAGNFKMLKGNLKGKRKMTAVRAAVVASDYPNEVVSLHVNEGKGKTIHSLRPYRGRAVVPVPALRFGELLKLYPDATAMKCDIEGGEHLLPWRILKSSGIRKLAIELHVAMPGQRNAAHETVREIKKAGFKEIVPHDLDTRMITLGFWER
jgi:FkbM family methyltransferase